VYIIAKRNVNLWDVYSQHMWHRTAYEEM